MNKRIKKIWLKALRSGKYEQGAGTLKQIDQEGRPRYCCLGVLQESIGCKISMDRYFEYRESKLTMLSDYMRNKVGLSKKHALELAIYNDDKVWSFKKIADWVEKNL